MIRMPKYRILFRSEILSVLGILPNERMHFSYRALEIDEDGMHLDSYWSDAVKATQAGIPLLSMTKQEALEIKALAKLSGSYFDAIKARLPERLERVIQRINELKSRKIHII